MSKLTKKAITDAFMELLQKKSLDKITVKDIIETAQINRNTFYYHYQDIYDLLEKIFQEEIERFLSESNPDSSFYEEYVRAARLFLDHEAAISHIYHSKSREVLHNYLEVAGEYFIGRFVDQASKQTALSQKGKAYITHFYTYALIGATLKWIDGQMPEDTDQVMKTISDSFEATIDIMIETYIKGHPEDL